MIPSNTDVAVLGGGFAGMACAAGLTRAGHKVLLLARRAMPAAVGEYLPPEGCAALAASGLDDVLKAPEHHRSPGVLSAWAGAPPVLQDALRIPGGQAWNLDRAAFERDIARHLRDAGVTIIPVERRPAISGTPGSWILMLDDGYATTAGFLVDATGRAAALASAMGAEMQRRDRLTGLALFCHGTVVANAALRVESLPSGWAYAAPLSQDRVVAVFLTDAAGMPRRMQARRAFAESALRAAPLIGPLLPDELSMAAFRSVPAWSQRTVPSLGPGWAAIGDAAMAFDPLASAGMTKALLDVRELRDLLAGSQDIGDLQEKRAVRYHGYLQNLDEHYATEVRFVDSAFWTRKADMGQRSRA